MTWRLLKRKITAPEGVRLRHSDGSSIRCDVLRDEDLDRNGVRAWVAVPSRQLPPLANGEAYYLDIDTLPAKSSVFLQFTISE